MTDFIEVADRVWVARYEWADANITAIGSDRGLVVVDTHGSVEAGRAVLDDLRRLGAGSVSAVVNTHWHWDHSFGNAAFREEYPEVPIHAHEDAARMLADQGDFMKQRFAESEDPHKDEVAATEIVLPDHTFSSTRSLDLGDRLVELVFPGRGHTDGDLLVRHALTLRGVHNYLPRHLVDAVDFAARHRGCLPLRELVGPRFPLDRLDEAFLTAAERRALRVAVAP